MTQSVVVTNKDVVTQSDKPLAIQDFENVLRFAIEKGAQLENIMAVRRELKAERAKEEFDDAMALFQSECPLIQKEKNVPTNTGKIAYSYAPIEAIEIQIRPYTKKYGFSHTFDADPSSANGWVIAKCIVKHRGGHSEVSTGKFPLGTKTQVMSDTQVYAAADTFAKRRALTNAYALIIVGEDMDGATGRMKPRGPSNMKPDTKDSEPLALKLWEVLAPIRKKNVKTWEESNLWLANNNLIEGFESLPNLSPDRYKEIISGAEKILAATVAK